MGDEVFERLAHRRDSLAAVAALQRGIGTRGGDLIARDINRAARLADADVDDNRRRARLLDDGAEISEFLALGVRGADDENALHGVLFPSPA